MLLLVTLLLQALSGPDPAQMEKAPELAYAAVPHGLQLPEGVAFGAPSSVATTSDGHLWVFNRGAHPLIEFDRQGRFVRSLGEGLYSAHHGIRVDANGNIWTTDVNGHTVTKMNAKGEVLLVLGVRGQAGDWKAGDRSGFLNEPTDVAVAPSGEIVVTEGHGAAEPRVLKFDRTGTLLKSWGGKGTAPGQFDIAHSVVIDRQGTIYVADRQNRRVQLFDRDGKYVKECKFAGLPCGLFLGGEGQMYLATGFAGQILRLAPDGKAAAMMGQPGKGLGQFGEAHYMTVAPAGEIYVGDTVNSVLHKFVKR